MLTFFKILFKLFGVVLFIVYITRGIKKYRRPSISEDIIYNLCERYINLYHNGDGYWLTDTEIQMYHEIEKRLKQNNII